MELNVEYEFSIIGISTVERDFKLAYNLNKYLNTSFVREDKDLDVKSVSEKSINYYSKFFYNDEENFEEWFLISNKYDKEESFSGKEKNIEGNLFFQLDQSIQVSKYLLPENKNANYILRIDLIENKSRLKSIVDKIINIPVVKTAFPIEYNTLRSKRNLIF